MKTEIMKYVETIPDMVDRAIVFATYAHQNVLRKSCTLPYILHPLEAGTIAAGITEDRDIIAAAILHDIVEDTVYEVEDLQHMFGERIARLVEAGTENKRRDRPSGETWKTRKQETIDYLRNQALYDEKVMMFSDKLANLRLTYNHHLNIGDQVWERFNVKDKEQHLWYFTKVLEACSELKDTAAYKEYSNLLSKLTD